MRDDSSCIDARKWVDDQVQKVWHRWCNGNICTSIFAYYFSTLSLRSFNICRLGCSPQISQFWRLDCSWADYCKTDSRRNIPLLPHSLQRPNIKTIIRFLLKNNISGLAIHNERPNINFDKLHAWRVEQTILLSMFWPADPYNVASIPALRNEWQR